MLTQFYRFIRRQTKIPFETRIKSETPYVYVFHLYCFSLRKHSCFIDFCHYIINW